MILIWILLFLFGLINAVQGIWPSPRTYTECVYIWREAKIYCLGGDIEPCVANKTSNRNKDDNSDGASDHDLQSSCRNSTESFYSLHINHDLDLSLLQDSWEIINNNMIPRKHFTMSALTGGTLNSIVISGGYIGKKSIKEEYITGIYDISRGFWTIQDKATDNKGDRPLVYGHSATVSSDETMIYTSGGLVNGGRDFETNISALPRSLFPVHFLNIFDAKERVWRFDPEAYDVRQFHKAVLGNDDIIYYIGGYASSYDREEYSGMYNLYGLSMHIMTTYDTKVVPSKNQILVFGGMDTYTGEALKEDNLWIFDINSMKWEIQDLNQENPNNSNSAITEGHYGHAAIIAEPYLFIMFGFDHNNKVTNNTWVIDTRSWKWVTSIGKVEPAPPNRGKDDKGDDDEEDYTPPTGWSDNSSDVVIGAIIGSLTGTAILIAIIGVGVHFKKKKRKQLNSTTLPTEAEESTATLNNDRDSLDNVNNDSDSITSVADSLPPYRLHDGGHQLPGIDAIDNTTSR
ncbi:hypothetical protein BDC45DRAFT_579462 [Circinella umbellata]|nr:hypothetical protein BDC45DRAFT_579462 [Circinella umbellata]